MSKKDSLNCTTLPLRKIRQRESAVPKLRYRRYQIADIINYALIEGDSKYLSFIDYVNTEIVHYKREVIGQKSGSAQTSGTTGGTTGGGSTGGSTGGTTSGGATPPSVEIEG